MSLKATAVKLFAGAENEELMHPTLVENAHTNVCLRKPKQFSDVKEYADRLLDGSALVIAYGDLSVPESARVADYLAGISYIAGATVTMVTGDILLYTPKQMVTETPWRCAKKY